MSEFMKQLNALRDAKASNTTGLINREKLKAQRKGKWIEDDDPTVKGHCSVCGWESHYYEDDVIGMPFCPNCGARMEGEEE